VVYFPHNCPLQHISDLIGGLLTMVWGTKLCGYCNTKFFSAIMKEFG
jgi:hypothetical protein